MRKRIHKLISRMHGRMVHRRRAERLASAIGPLLETGCSVADIGCGDGAVGRNLAALVAGLRFRRLEIAGRADLPADVELFDGRTLPLDEASVDFALLVDVLHHTSDPMVLLRESMRVARRAVILKDHRLARPLARRTLQLMDWVGNRPHGVAMPGNYWSDRQWVRAWRELGLIETTRKTRLSLYPMPWRLLFEPGLHFLVRLEHTSGQRDQSVLP